ncbi:uncharacterized protein LAESUDRAFT_718870, partial [Laetiporus sulphureus 93-53]
MHNYLILLTASALMFLSYGPGALSLWSSSLHQCTRTHTTPSRRGLEPDWEFTRYITWHHPLLAA